jgi:hypothetical protein
MPVLHDLLRMSCQAPEVHQAVGRDRLGGRPNRAAEQPVFTCLEGQWWLTQLGDTWPVLVLTASWLLSSHQSCRTLGLADGSVVAELTGARNPALLAFVQLRQTDIRWGHVGVEALNDVLHRTTRKHDIRQNATLTLQLHRVSRPLTIPAAFWLLAGSAAQRRCAGTLHGRRSAAEGSPDNCAPDQGGGGAYGGGYGHQQASAGAVGAAEPVGVHGRARLYAGQGVHCCDVPDHNVRAQGIQAAETWDVLSDFGNTPVREVSQSIR